MSRKQYAHRAHRQKHEYGVESADVHPVGPEHMPAQSNPMVPKSTEKAQEMPTEHQEAQKVETSAPPMQTREKKSK